nr:hypothetical protein [Sphingopyxis sp. UBA6723]
MKHARKNRHAAGELQTINMGCHEFWRAHYWSKERRSVAAIGTGHAQAQLLLTARQKGVEGAAASRRASFSVGSASHPAALRPAIKICNHTALGFLLQKDDDGCLGVVVDEAHRGIACAIALGIATFDFVRPNFDCPHWPFLSKPLSANGSKMPKLDFGCRRAG